jgi:probable rRNA maturation factor
MTQARMRKEKGASTPAGSMPARRPTTRRNTTLRVVAQTKLGAGITMTEVMRRLKRMMHALALKGVELSVMLTDDAQMRKLNHLYRKKDRTTDVLAFAMNEGASNPRSAAAAMPRLLGDVIVSIPTARIQAKEADRAVIDEVSMLLAHGLLHLLGWDHPTAARDKAMRLETERICAVAQERPKGATRRTQRRHGRPGKLS